MRINWLLFFIPLNLFAEIGYVEPWGNDAGITTEIALTSTERQNLTPLAFLAEKGILFHQNVVSPITGPRSHYRPSSSQYMLEAIHKNGFIKGYLMGCDRLLRENGEEWVYDTKLFSEILYKWDPPEER